MNEQKIINIYKEIELKLQKIKEVDPNHPKIQELETLLVQLKEQASLVGVDVEASNVIGEIDTIDDRLELVNVSTSSEKVKAVLIKLIEKNNSTNETEVLTLIQTIDAIKIYKKRF